MIIQTQNQKVTLEQLIAQLKQFPTRYNFSQEDGETWKANCELLKLYAIEHALNHGERPKSILNN